MADLAVQLLQIESLADAAEVEHKLRGLVLSDSAADVEAIKVKETAIQKLCDLLVKNGNAAGLRELLSQLRDFFSVVPKAKTAKIVRAIIDSIAKIPGSQQLQVGRECKRLHRVHADSDLRRRRCARSRSNGPRRRSGPSLGRESSCD